MRSRTRASLGIISSVATLSALLAVPATAPVGAGTLQVPGDEAAAVTSEKTTGTYIVVTQDDPTSTYDGDTAGYAATRGQNPNSARVRKYEKFLEKEQDQALRRAGIPGNAKGQAFTAALSGFTAELTESQAAQLRADARVLTVAPNEIRQLTTDTTPDFLGLTDPDEGLWTQDPAVLGEDVVVGVIDSGIRPESASFADDGSYGPLDDWAGECELGDEPMFAELGGCSDKLIGARWYVDGFGGAEQTLADYPEEFLSPLDADGHGTHTASTAAGNGGVTTPYGDISGIAPRARVAAYKVCWGYSGEGGCSSADSVAAIDQAVLDGVDVINYSISGTQDNFLDPVEVAFLFAADAGVVVNASAGNDGPGLATANHPSPWLTTVAAGTEVQSFTGTVTIGDERSFEGAPSVGSEGTDGFSPLVYAGDIANAQSTAADAALCLEGTLDPAQAAGNIVLCDRGVIARVDKSAEAASAGAVGMILANVGENSINSDAHSIPSIHVDFVAGDELRAYIQDDAGAEAAISAASITDAVAPDVAAFSSRGPLAGGDILVPDILAPGVDVLAAYSPTIGGRDFDYLSGTSMSSPHMAGMSALLKQAQPDWSPAAIRSAFMTTAYQDRTDGSPIEGGPFAYGSGHASPNDAVDPGLVYDAGFVDYFGFLCGTGQLASPDCAVVGIDPSDLNQPNIAIGSLAGVQTVTRTVTNVDDAAATYTADVSAPAGVDVAVEPATFTVEPGATATYTVTFTVTADAPVGEPAFGELTWSDGDHDVTSQLVVTPTLLAAPGELDVEGRRGSAEYDVTFGYDGDFTAAAHGMYAPTEVAGTVVDDPANDINAALASGVGVTFEEVVVPAGAVLARFATFDDETDGADDLDLYVFDPEFNFVGSSGTATSEEVVDVPFPAPGTYTVAVHGWQTDGPDANYTLFGWSVLADPSADAGTLQVDAPTEAVLGQSATVTVEWGRASQGAKNGKLRKDTRYLGAVSYSDAEGLLDLTLVDLDT